MISYVNFRFVSGSILEAVLARLGIYFWSFEGSKSYQNVIKIDAKTGIGKSRVREGPVKNALPELMARRGVRGGRRLGRDEDKEERKKVKIEDRAKALQTPRPSGSAD